MTYTQWLEEWLENYVRPSVKTRTYERYRTLAELHIATNLGEREIDGITPLCLQRFVTYLLQEGNRKTGNGLSPNTVNTVISVLQGSMRTACIAGLAHKNPAEKIKRPRLAEKPVECFTITEQKRIEEAVFASKKDKLFGIVLCLYTGLRIGELLALKWQNGNISKGILVVSASCHDGKSGLVFETPKTASSRREIPLPKQLIPLLKAAHKKNSSAFVVSERQEPICVRSYQRSFELLLKRLKIPHRGFHALRHTFATRALECGMDVKTLSEILGHKNPSVTLTRYAHSLLEHKKEMMNRLGKLL